MGRVDAAQGQGNEVNGFWSFRVCDTGQRQTFITGLKDGVSEMLSMIHLV